MKRICIDCNWDVPAGIEQNECWVCWIEKTGSYVRKELNVSHRAEWKKKCIDCNWLLNGREEAIQCWVCWVENIGRINDGDLEILRREEWKDDRI